MTLINKSWLKNEVTRLYLLANSQENIAKELHISVGIVNNLVNEIMKSDDTIELQRQIAIIAKKNGIDIKQIAANLRWKNEIKLAGLDDRKIEKFLDAMDILFNKYSIPSTTAAKQFYSLIETMIKHDIAPHRLEEEIKSKQDELLKINAQVEDNEKLLQESSAKLDKEQANLGIKQKNLDQFCHVRNLLDLFGRYELSEEYGTLARAMIDFKNLNYDAKDIVSKYEKMESLTRANEKLEEKLHRSEKILESYRRMQKEAEANWKDDYNAFQMFSSLIKDGLRKEDIFNVIHILHKDFPESAIPQLIDDVKTYGSLAASTWKSQREYDAENEIML